MSTTRITQIIVATITMAITTPVIAEPTWTNYYIVRDNATMQCKIVDVKPTPDGTSGGTAYESRALAQAALSAGVILCLPNPS